MFVVVHGGLSFARGGCVCWVVIVYGGWGGGGVLGCGWCGWGVGGVWWPGLR